MRLQPFNLNDNVWVTLTDTGVRILRERHEELRALAPSVGPFEEIEERRRRFQLWDLMSIFGEHIYMGATEQPFEIEIKLVLPD